MRTNFYLENSKSKGLTIEYLRVSLFLVVLFVSIISSIVQGIFVNWSVLGPFYGILTFALGLHLLWILIWEKLLEKPAIFFLGFLLDSILISLLIFYFGVNQSLFLFLHLVNILLAGLVCRGSGAVILALITSISFTGAVIFSPDIKALNFFFLLVLNNIAFFSVAGLSSYLSEQLQDVGKKLEKTGVELRAAEEFNQVLIANIPSGMLTFSQSGEIIQFNSSAADILNIKNLFGLNWFSLFPGFEFEPGDKFKGDLRYTLDSESTIKTLGTNVCKIFSPELETYIAIALFEDLTKIRQLEYNLRQNEKMAAVGGLAAGIAHEIRNPLAGISGSVEMLSQTTNNEDDKKLMKIILREIDRLNNLITEFLDYAKPETPPTERVNLGPILREVLEAMTADSKLRKDIQQVTAISDDLVILGRRDKLKQVFLNIVLNSYQAMSDQDATQKELKLFVGGHAEAEKIEIRIRDTGCGMSESTRKKMFEPFHTTKPKGTGLGLAVTHKILEGHGANIYVESEQGRGTEFVLTFPKSI